MNKTYPCKDLMIAACILSKDIPLIETIKNDNFLTFIFDDYEKCREIENNWWNGTVTVIGPRYAESIKRLKNLLFTKL